MASSRPFRKVFERTDFPQWGWQAGALTDFPDDDTNVVRLVFPRTDFPQDGWLSDRINDSYQHAMAQLRDAPQAPYRNIRLQHKPLWRDVVVESNWLFETPPPTDFYVPEFYPAMALLALTKSTETRGYWTSGVVDMGWLGALTFDAGFDPQLYAANLPLMASFRVARASKPNDLRKWAWSRWPVAIFSDETIYSPAWTIHADRMASRRIDKLLSRQSYPQDAAFFVAMPGAPTYDASMWPALAQLLSAFRSEPWHGQWVVDPHRVDWLAVLDLWETGYGVPVRDQSQSFRMLRARTDQTIIRLDQPLPDWVSVVAAQELSAAFHQLLSSFRDGRELGSVSVLNDQPQMGWIGALGLTDSTGNLAQERAQFRRVFGRVFGRVN